MIQQILAQHPFPPILTKPQLVRHLQFCHAIMVATDSLLVAAGMDEKHAQEQGHAEWLAQDLAALGIPTTPYDYAAAAIAGAQYYFIHHLDPRVLLGYCAVLECRTFTPMQVEVMEAVMGGALPCVRFHADHDPAHGADVIRQIQAIDDATVLEWVYRNAEQTAAAIAAIMTVRLAKEPTDVRTSSVSHDADPDDRRHRTRVSPHPHCDGAHAAAWDGSAGDGCVGRA